MSYTIKRRDAFGGTVIFESTTATTACEAVTEMRRQPPVGGKLDLRGAHLRGAYLRGANLRGADLWRADLRGADLRGAYLEGADLEGAYLEGADLRGAYLEGADLRGAYLEGANLEGANLWRAYAGGGNPGRGLTPENLGLSPADPAFGVAVIDHAMQEGALYMAQWHTCETTHCLAGWAVHLAGAAGKALEAVTSSPVAGSILAPWLAHLFYVTDDQEALAALPAIRQELVEMVEMQEAKR